MENYYDILGVKWNASQEEIKAGYREQLHKFHPDVTVFDKEYAEKRIAMILAAYKVLKNPARRRAYNAKLVLMWTKEYYNQNWQDTVENVIINVKTFWDNVGIDCKLIFVLLSVPLLIKYSFAF